MSIKQTDLEKYLWGAATLLRGVIDAGDYKQYIFPLLFYKRICDVYDEEYEKALGKGTNAEKKRGRPKKPLAESKENVSMKA